MRRAFSTVLAVLIVLPSAAFAKANGPGGACFGMSAIAGLDATDRAGVPISPLYGQEPRRSGRVLQ